MSANLIQDLLVKFKQAQAIEDVSSLLADIKAFFNAKEEVALVAQESLDVPDILRDLPTIGKENLVMPVSIEQIEEVNAPEADIESNYFRRLKIHTAEHTQQSFDVKSDSIHLSKLFDQISFDIHQSLKSQLDNLDLHANHNVALPVTSTTPVMPAVAPMPAAAAAGVPAAVGGGVPAAVGGGVPAVGGGVPATGGAATGSVQGGAKKADGTGKPAASAKDVIKPIAKDSEKAPSTSAKGNKVKEIAKSIIDSLFGSKDKSTDVAKKAQEKAAVDKVAAAEKAAAEKAAAEKAAAEKAAAEKAIQDHIEEMARIATLTEEQRKLEAQEKAAAEKASADKAAAEKAAAEKAAAEKVAVEKAAAEKAAAEKAAAEKAAAEKAVAEKAAAEKAAVEKAAAEKAAAEKALQDRIEEMARIATLTEEQRKLEIAEKAAAELAVAEKVAAEKAAAEKIAADLALAEKAAAEKAAAEQAAAEKAAADKVAQDRIEEMAKIATQTEKQQEPKASEVDQGLTFGKAKDALFGMLNFGKKAQVKSEFDAKAQSEVDVAKIEEMAKASTQKSAVGENKDIDPKALDLLADQIVNSDDVGGAPAHANNIPTPPPLPGSDGANAGKIPAPPPPPGSTEAKEAAAKKAVSFAVDNQPKVVEGQKSTSDGNVDKKAFVGKTQPGDLLDAIKAGKKLKKVESSEKKVDTNLVAEALFKKMGNVTQHQPSAKDTDNSSSTIDEHDEFAAQEKLAVQKQQNLSKINQVTASIVNNETSKKIVSAVASKVAKALDTDIMKVVQSYEVKLRKEFKIPEQHNEKLQASIVLKLEALKAVVVEQCSKAANEVFENYFKNRLNDQFVKVLETDNLTEDKLVAAAKALQEQSDVAEQVEVILVRTMKDAFSQEHFYLEGEPTIVYEQKSAKLGSAIGSAKAKFEAAAANLVKKPSATDAEGAKAAPKSFIPSDSPAGKIKAQFEKDLAALEKEVNDLKPKEVVEAKPVKSFEDAMKALKKAHGYQDDDSSDDDNDFDDDFDDVKINKMAEIATKTDKVDDVSTKTVEKTESSSSDVVVKQVVDAAPDVSKSAPISSPIDHAKDAIVFGDKTTSKVETTADKPGFFESAFNFGKNVAGKVVHTLHLDSLLHTADPIKGLEPSDIEHMATAATEQAAPTANLVVPQAIVMEHTMPAIEQPHVDH